MKLRFVLFISLSLAALIPVVFLGVWPQSRAYEKEIADVSERHLLLAQNLSSALERYSRDVKATFKTLTLNMVAQTKLSGTDEILANLNFRHICIASLTDRSVVGTLNEQIAACPKHVPSERFAIFRAIASPDEVKFTQVMIGPDGQPIMYVVWPINNQLAIGSITTDYFVNLGKAISFGKKGHAAIVDHNGNVLAHPIKSWHRTIKNIAKVPAVKRMLNHETGVSTFFSPALKADMIAGFTWVPGANWGVMIPQPLSELRDRADAVQQYAMRVIIAGVIVTAILSWLLSGYLTRPVLAVIAAAHQLAAGKFHQRVAPDNHTMPLELKTLQKSFNGMAEALEESASKQALALNEFTAVLETINYGVLFMDTNLKARIINRAYQDMWGIPDDMVDRRPSLPELIHLSLQKGLYNVEEAYFDDFIERRVSAVKAGSFPAIEIERADGMTFEYQCTALNDGERMITYFDITERKKAEEQIRHLANHDALTGLPTKYLAKEKMRDSFAMAERHAWKIAVMFIDLDDFKAVNDTLGHDAGDDLLKQVGERFSLCLRDTDLVARIGGDEFLVIQTEVKTDDGAIKVAQNLISSAMAPFNINGHDIKIGASIGIALFPDHAKDEDSMIKIADTAMYEAKKSGKNQYSIAPQMKKPRT